MPVQWTPDNDQLLLFLTLSTQKISIDAAAIANAWPKGRGAAPTARAIQERVVKIRKMAVAMGAGDFSVGNASTTVGRSTEVVRKLPVSLAWRKRGVGSEGDGGDGGKVQAGARALARKRKVEGDGEGGRRKSVKRESDDGDGGDEGEGDWKRDGERLRDGGDEVDMFDEGDDGADVEETSSETYASEV